MENYLVKKVTDGQTAEVSPEWVWAGRFGNRIRIIALDAPEDWTHLSKTAKAELHANIENKSVLLNPLAVDIHGRLLATYSIAET